VVRGKSKVGSAPFFIYRVDWFRIAYFVCRISYVVYRISSLESARADLGQWYCENGKIDKAARTVTAEEKPALFGPRRVYSRFGAGSGGRLDAQGTFFLFFLFFFGWPESLYVLVCQVLTPPLSRTQDKKRLLGLRVEIFTLTILIESC